jgi:hypothetical protein
VHPRNLAWALGVIRIMASTRGSANMSLFTKLLLANRNWIGAGDTAPQLSRTRQGAGGPVVLHRSALAGRPQATLLLPEPETIAQMHVAKARGTDDKTENRGGIFRAVGAP